MRAGCVGGDIQYRERVVDGEIKGNCEAGAIVIDAHALIDGTITYKMFSIKNGGIFTGRADRVPG
jgi:cytoskeletal protein CcmA (bactofilin family)